MESFTDCSAGTKDDQYKHNFFTIPQTLQLILSLGIRSFLFFKTYSMVKWASNIYARLLSFLSTATMSGCCAQFCGQFEWENLVVTCILLIPPLALAHDHTSFGSNQKPNFIIIIIIIIKIKEW